MPQPIVIAALSRALCCTTDQLLGLAPYPTPAAPEQTSMPVLVEKPKRTSGDTSYAQMKYEQPEPPAPATKAWSNAEREEPVTFEAVRDRMLKGGRLTQAN